MTPWAAAAGTPAYRSPHLPQGRRESPARIENGGPVCSGDKSLGPAGVHTGPPEVALSTLTRRSGCPGTRPGRAPKPGRRRARGRRPAWPAPEWERPEPLQKGRRLGRDLHVAERIRGQGPTLPERGRVGSQGRRRGGDRLLLLRARVSRARPAYPCGPEEADQVFPLHSAQLEDEERVAVELSEWPSSLRTWTPRARAAWPP